VEEKKEKKKISFYIFPNAFVLRYCGPFMTGEKGIKHKAGIQTLRHKS